MRDAAMVGLRCEGNRKPPMLQMRSGLETACDSAGYSVRPVSVTV